MTGFVVAAIVMLVAVVPCGIVLCRGRAVEALVAPVLVVLAVFIRSGLTENTGESVVALVFIVISGPYLTHATVRAIRARERDGGSDAEEAR